MSTLGKNLGKCFSPREEAVQAEKQGNGSIIGSLDFDQKLISSSPGRITSTSRPSSWLSELLGLSCTDGGHPSCRREEEMKCVDDDNDKIVEGEKVNKKEEMREAGTYIHPLVKKSANSLSRKSLDVCTESLGSETGSDDFSLSPLPEKMDEMLHVEHDDITDCADRDYQFSPFPANKKPPKRTFPPPIPCRYFSGLSWKTRSHRNGGRLVLDVISTDLTQNYFRARRSDGRLVLTLIGDAMEEVVPEAATQKQNIGSETEQFHVTIKSSQEENNGEEDDDERVEKGTKTISKDVGKMDNRLWVFCNKFEKRHQKFKFEVEHGRRSALAQSELPWPPETRVASLFAAPLITKVPWPLAPFEYCWNLETMVICSLGDDKSVLFEDTGSNNGHRMLAWRGKQEYFVH